MSSSQYALWATNSGYGVAEGPYNVVLQDDGLLVVLGKPQYPVWSTITNAIQALPLASDFVQLPGKK